MVKQQTRKLQGQLAEIREKQAEKKQKEEEDAKEKERKFQEYKAKSKYRNVEPEPLYDLDKIKQKRARLDELEE